MSHLSEYLSNITSISRISATAITFDNIQHPEQLFTQVADTPWSAWLDSCESEHVDSNYDILVWHPATTIETVGDITTIKSSYTDTLFKSSDDPLSLVSEVNKSFFSNVEFCPIAQSLPFKAGSLGLFGYDLGRRFEKMPTTSVKDVALADMAIGVYLNAVIYDRAKDIFYAISETSNLDAFVETLMRLDYAPVQQDAFSLTSDWQANMSQAQYTEKFEQVQEYLLSGDCYQINLAQRFSANYQGDEFAAYQTLRAQNKAPFSAFIRLEEQSVLSISPERFLQVDDGKVQTKPIKGTKPRSANIEIDNANATALKNATKDRAENLMIVDLLRNDLSKVCQPGSVKVPEIFAIESFPAVHHLVSTVVGELETSFNATDLLRGAFPGGSITGAPKIRAMEIIEELEPHRRNLYCGSIGYISACGNMDTSITIRTLICENNRIHCWAGGGLVADSTADSEYQETLDKVNKILPILSNMAN